MRKSKIFLFSLSATGGEGMCYALAEDGTILAGHYCSNEAFAQHDLGLIDDTPIGAGWMDKREAYRKHYPDGYELEFVFARDYPNHAGINAARALNHARYAEEAAKA